MLARFYRPEDELLRLQRGLKQTACPACKATGTLNLHGWLYGYGEHDEQRKSRRGRRIYCNNRKRRRNGCGRTFSVWAADKLKRMRLSAGALGAFLAFVFTLGDKAAAWRAAGSDLSVSCAYRLWTRFLHAQSRLRAALVRLCPSPPERSHAGGPAEQTLAHLRAAFPHDPCLVSAFQHRLQAAFL
ncbi:MAG: hypothetical protein M5U26_03650 [Planctomycetota bacterium]|nr:hypothetical protein [Planctomycetota bacterium]